MMHSAALAVSGLHASYAKREVLKGITLTVQPGEIFGLLGSNGAGKTTLIRVICGRLRPSAGSVTIAGKAAGARGSRDIGLVPQDIALYPYLTVRENLEVFGRLAGLSRYATKAAVDDACGVTDLGACLDERIEVLSGGWKRRVNIAAAILHRPPLLILDEPTVGVDIRARNELHEVIHRLSGLQMGVLIATHDLSQAELLCTRVGFLSDGLIVPQGHSNALLDAAFGAQREIILEFMDVLPAHQKVRLKEMGFTPIGGFSWSTIGDYPATDLCADLERTGIRPHEIRIKKPGLDSLFIRLCGPDDKFRRQQQS